MNAHSAVQPSPPTPLPEGEGGGFDAYRARADFPVLRQTAHGRPLVYLDSANTAQKPQCVIDAERRVYEECYANVHRGVYELSARAEQAFEGAREKLRRFVGAARAARGRSGARHHRGHQPGGASASCAAGG